MQALPRRSIDLLWQLNSEYRNDRDDGGTTDGLRGRVFRGRWQKTWKTLTNADRPSDLGANTIYTHSGVVPGKPSTTYRVFPWHRSAYGLPVTIDGQLRTS